MGSSGPQFVLNYGVPHLLLFMYGEKVFVGYVGLFVPLVIFLKLPSSGYTKSALTV
jgi:hypothetical protein